MTVLKSDSMVVAKQGMPSTTIDDELVLLDLAADNYVGLDAIGRRIWERIAEPTQVSALCDGLATQYSGPADAIRDDVMTFLDTLHGNGLIQVVNG